MSCSEQQYASRQLCIFQVFCMASVLDHTSYSFLMIKLAFRLRGLYNVSLRYYISVRLILTAEPPLIIRCLVDFKGHRPRGQQLREISHKIYKSWDL